MRKLVVLSFLSLDGVMQAPGGSEEDAAGGFKYGGWIVPYADAFTGKIMKAQMKGPFDLLLGRKTYDIFSSYWPDNESGWPGVNQARKYVASKTLRNPAWENTVVLKTSLVEKIRKLKRQKGPDLHVYGSGDFAQTLFKHDLVDELWLKIFPVTLGAGKRLFAKGAIPAAFKLADCQVSPKGVLIANYKRAGKVKTGSFD